MKHEERLGIQNAAVQVVNEVLRVTVRVWMCRRRCPPVVGSESGSQSDAGLSFILAGRGVHAASAAGARVQGERSGLIVLKEGNAHLLQPELLLNLKRRKHFL